MGFRGGGGLTKQPMQRPRILHAVVGIYLGPKCCAGFLVPCRFRVPPAIGTLAKLPLVGFLERLISNIGLSDGVSYAHSFSVLVIQETIRNYPRGIMAKDGKCARVRHLSQVRMEHGPSPIVHPECAPAYKTASVATKVAIDAAEEFLCFCFAHGLLFSVNHQLPPNPGTGRSLISIFRPRWTREPWRMPRGMHGVVRNLHHVTEGLDLPTVIPGMPQPIFVVAILVCRTNHVIEGDSLVRGQLNQDMPLGALDSHTL